MNRLLILVVILFPYFDCMGGSYDLDTIDNWQVYNGDNLIFSGNETMMSEIQVTLNYDQLKDIKVVYRHCVQRHDNKVILWATVLTDKAALWTKEFAANYSGEYVIPLAEIGAKLTGKDSLTLWYGEKENALVTKLGKILITR